MSDTSQGEGWWVASDGKWYAPEQHPDYVPPTVLSADVPNYAAETLAVPKAEAHPGPDFTVPAQPLATPGAGSGPSTETYNPTGGVDVGVATANDPNYNLPASADGTSKSRRGLLLGVGALVLVAGLGFLAFRFFSGGASGGASSPEAAIDQLITSVNERDAVGFVDVFDPDEIDAWIGSFEPAFADFEEIDEDGQSTNDLSEVYTSIFESFDYTLTGPNGEDVTYEIEPLGDSETISRVRVEGLDFAIETGDADSAIIFSDGGVPLAVDVSQFDATRLELRDERGGLAARLFIPGEPAADEFAQDVHLDLVTVQKDGKWFVSIGYSILELARQNGGFDNFVSPDYGRAFELVESQEGGAESADAVVQEFFDSIGTLDYENMIRLTDPYATPYLHDYQPLIDDSVDDGERRDVARETDIRIDELELEVSEWEGRTLVTFDDVNGTSSQGDFFLDTQNWCITVEDEFSQDRACARDGIGDLLFEAGSTMNATDFIPDETGVIVVERNGRWYLSPLATMGYYMDQIAADAVALQEELGGNTSTELANFFVTEGPIARQGVPGITQAASGAAGVALDLSGYPTAGRPGEEFHVAVARVATDQPGAFVTDLDNELTGEDWVVVYDRADGDRFELPAIGVSAEGTLDVELFEVTVTEVGIDGFNGQLGGQGRPQVFTFTDEAAQFDIRVQGARAEAVGRFENQGIVLSGVTDGRLFDPHFAVVTGDPGQTFEIIVDVPEPEPEPELEPEIEPGVLGNPVADSFASFVALEGYSFTETQSGGFFDGCNGPDDPDVTSYLFENFSGQLALVTPYPSASRAQSSFDALLSIESPCPAFTELEVISIEVLSADEVLIEWQFVDDDNSTFELYRFAGDSVVVVSSGSAGGADEQMAPLRSFGG